MYTFAGGGGAELRVNHTLPTPMPVVQAGKSSVSSNSRGIRKGFSRRNPAFVAFLSSAVSERAKIDHAVLVDVIFPLLQAWPASGTSEGYRGLSKQLLLTLSGDLDEHLG